MFYRNAVLQSIIVSASQIVVSEKNHTFISLEPTVFAVKVHFIIRTTLPRYYFSPLQHSLEQWAEWLERVVEQVLQPHVGRDTFPKAARQFLLKWSFYSSMIIRDLTLRSAASFGSFHLIRLLYDEYMFYLIEHKVADATQKSPLAVMAEVCLYLILYFI